MQENEISVYIDQIESQATISGQKDSRLASGILQAVARFIEDREEHAKRVKAEQQVTPGVSHELEA